MNIVHRDINIDNGRDKIILFIHGFLGSPIFFEPFMLYFARNGYDCRACLLPGHGGDSRRFSDADLSVLDSFVENEINSLKERYSVVHLVGHSLGGLLALNYASRNKVDGIVAISSPLSYTPSLKHTALTLKVAFGGPGDEVVESMRRFRGVGETKIYEYPLWIPNCVYLANKMKASRAVLPEVKARTLAIYSKNDELANWKDGFLMKKLLKNKDSKLIMLNKSTHAHFYQNELKFVITQMRRYFNETEKMASI